MTLAQLKGLAKQELLETKNLQEDVRHQNQGQY